MLEKYLSTLKQVQYTLLVGEEDLPEYRLFSEFQNRLICL